jgi:hypothetical protein
MASACCSHGSFDDAVSRTLLIGDGHMLLAAFIHDAQLVSIIRIAMSRLIASPLFRSSAAYTP